MDFSKVKEKISLFLDPIIKRLKRLFSEKSFSKGQMLVFCGIIIYGTFLYTEVDAFLFFVGGTLAGWFTGYMGLKRVREILERAEAYINNPENPIDKKYVKAVQSVHASCAYLGHVMDLYNLEQGTAPYLKDLKGGEKKSG